MAGSCRTQTLRLKVDVQTQSLVNPLEVKQDVWQYCEKALEKGELESWGRRGISSLGMFFSITLNFVSLIFK